MAHHPTRPGSLTERMRRTSVVVYVSGGLSASSHAGTEAAQEK
jgi:hypothetical protein